MTVGAARRAAVRVWDPLVRVLHWALVASVAAGWATTFWFGGWHEAAGWAALAIVAVRIVWGVVGPSRARFAEFVRGPRPTLRYASDVLAARERRHVGHNPLGGWMVVALFTVVIGLAFTGWLYGTDRFWGDETVERVHVALAWTIVALVVAHVAGVALASLRHRENLVAAMLHGMKREARNGDVV